MTTGVKWGEWNQTEDSDRVPAGDNVPGWGNGQNKITDVQIKYCIVIFFPTGDVDCRRSLTGAGSESDGGDVTDHRRCRGLPRGRAVGVGRLSGEGVGKGFVGAEKCGETRRCGRM